MVNDNKIYKQKNSDGTANHNDSGDTISKFTSEIERVSSAIQSEKESEDEQAEPIAHK